MSGKKGSDLLLKIGNGAMPEVFTTIGAARAVGLSINNNPLDVSALNGQGLQIMAADAGLQEMEISLDGLFKDSAAEELLRITSFNRTLKNYQLIFPNGDKVGAAFAVVSYNRSGTYDGLEAFSVKLRRSGSAQFMQGV